MEKKHKVTKKNNNKTKDTKANKITNETVKIEIDKKHKALIESRKQSTMFFIIIAIFVMLILIGVLAGKNMKPAFGVETHVITFRTAIDRDLSSAGYNEPPEGKCQTDEYGFLDPQCAYKIACICGGWSKRRGYIYNGSECANPDIYNSYEFNPRSINNTDLFTKKFDTDETYYCESCSSSQGCPTMPTESCYVCEGGSGPVKTINETRAATMTGVSDISKCHAVSDEECQPKPSTKAPTTTPPTTKAPTTTPPTTKAPTTTPPTTKAPTTTPPTTKAPTTTPPSTKSGNSCYSCTLGTGKEYTYASNKEEASTITGGKNCLAVSKNYCDNPKENCYSCDTKDGKKYVSTTTIENAKKAIDGGKNCTIVKNSYCEIVPNNPKTGVAGIVIVWIVGISALVYSFIHFIKLKK